MPHGVVALLPPDPSSTGTPVTRAFATVSGFILVRERLTIVAGQHHLMDALILRLLESVVEVSLGMRGCVLRE